jgi:hypothetical protein
MSRRLSTVKTNRILVQNLIFCHPLGRTTEYETEGDPRASDVCLAVQDLRVDGNELELWSVMRGSVYRG